MMASAVVENIVVLGNACLLLPLICVADVLVVRANTVRVMGKHS